MINKRVEVVAAIVVDSQHRILMAQRADWQHQGGKWEFPGGKIESGETHMQALARELSSPPAGPRLVLMSDRFFPPRTTSPRWNEDPA